MPNATAAPVSVPPAPAPAAVAAPGITPEQLTAIAEGRRACRKIHRAVTVASISGWTMAFFAFVTLISGLFSLRALLLGVALTAIAFIELRGARRLRGFDLAAPRQLALNQIGLVASITLYATWGIYEALTGPGKYAEHIAAGGQVADMLQPIDDLTRAVSIGVGLALIVGSALAQGGAAWYYATRRAHVQRFLHATPSWVVEAIRA